MTPLIKCGVEARVASLIIASKRPLINTVLSVHIAVNSAEPSGNNTQ